MQWFILCIFFVSLHKGISASLADQMAEMTQQCCEQGTAHARTHGGTDCPSAVPPGVHPMFSTLCTYAMDQCCKEHYKKKEACESGIDIATRKQDCSLTKDSSKKCCDECLKGSAAGIARGGSACIADTRGLSGDQLLAGNAFNTCCQKSASKSVRTETVTRRPGDAIVTRKPLEDELTSVCDDFAPNELCAHHCIPIPGSYKCECNPGFRLMADKKNCMEVEKNRCKPHNPCQHKCNDNGIAVLCSCRRGYQLMADGKSCEDIDECLLNPPVCLPNTQCVNIQGSYKCILKKINNVEKGQCPPGFSRNILNNACDDINECKLPQPPCPSYLCENTVGAYKCGGIKGDPSNLPKKHSTTEDQCPPGFKSSGNDECEDVDECVIHKDDCNPMSQFCINTKGSFYCQDKVSKHCPPGFKIDPVTNKCEDINECEEEEDICKPNQVCVNLPGEYNCKSVKESSTTVKHKCADGLRYTSEYHGCVDIDECAEGIHICDQYQTCHNTFGSHECHCNVGFELDTTTGACVDINECATEQNDCIAQSQRCDNTVGSYLCVRFISCGTGYILHHSSSKCEDIDECALGTHNCGRAGPEYRCHNIPGSFRCVRRATTTTSTAAPEYEYEYYDSEEEIVDENKNSSNSSPDNKSTLDKTLTTAANSTTSESPKETTTPKPPEIKTTLHPDIDIDKPAEIPIDHTQEEDLKNNVYTIDNDKNVVSNSEPSQPEIIKESIPTSSESIYRIEYTPTEPPKIAETFTPIPSEPSKSTDSEDEISYIPIDERPAGPKRTENTEQPGPKYDLDPINKLPAELPHIKPLDPKENEIDTYETVTKAVTQPTSPQVVFVEVGKETATVRGEQTPDGSVVVDTNEVPTNEWTKINAKPVDCQFGFERDAYGACYDIDECATNRHICSGLTEICRNTMGGYLCDCADGFRRDLASGTCVFITWSTSISTPTTTSTTTTMTPPPPPPPPPTLPPMPPPTLPPTPPPTSPSTPPPTMLTNPPSTPPPTTTPSSTTPPPTLPPTVPTTLPPTPPPTSPTPPPTPPPPPPTTERKIFWGYPEYRPFTTRPFKSRNICEMGYHFNTNTRTCEDINECTNGQANCASVEICVNTEGGYRCECPPNWELDSRRQRCVPIRNNQHFPQGYGNEPTYNAVGPIHYGTTGRPSKPQVNVVEDRVNKCPAGYELGDDNLCHDVDECLTGEAKCGFMQLCTNLPGGYTCSCPTGYTLVGDHECEDVDECAVAGSIPVCSQNADCINTLGSYQCRCHSGFRAAPRNDKVCIDVDECVENRAGSLCQQRCNNVWGGYRCSCHRGYRLSHDNSSCTDVDECVEFKTRHLCDGKCLNEPGSYRCSCPKGYRLSEDKRSCIDIDECETGEAPCAQSSPYAVTSDICVNMRGGYHCHRIICPPGYKIESRHRCTKIDATCAPSDRNCTHQPSTYSYNFITFVSKLYIPDPSVDLFTMKGPVWPTARMRFELKLVEVNAPPTVKERADINSFMLLQRGNNQGVITLVKSLEGPQSIELELSMELYNRGQFAGIAVAKLYIYVSEYEF